VRFRIENNHYRSPLVKHRSEGDNVNPNTGDGGYGQTPKGVLCSLTNAPLNLAREFNLLNSGKSGADESSDPTNNIILKLFNELERSMNTKIQQLAVYQRQLSLEVVERQRQLVNDEAHELLVKLDNSIQAFVSNSDQLVRPLITLKAELVATTEAMVVEKIEEHYRGRAKQARASDPLRLKHAAYHQTVLKQVVDKQSTGQQEGNRRASDKSKHVRQDGDENMSPQERERKVRHRLDLELEIEQLKRDQARLARELQQAMDKNADTKPTLVTIVDSDDGLGD
jgi:hypothetical protein